MFIVIKEYIEDPHALVCVLIGEVESFSHAQQSTLTDTLPTNSVRVVNILSAKIEQFRR